MDGNCMFVIKKKGRRCRMQALEGEKFCGEHIVGADVQKAVLTNQGKDRIPCPLDPSHTCFASRLECHLRKCNARQTELPPYYVQDRNVGPGCVEADLGPTLHQVSDDQLLSLLRRIEHQWQERVPVIPELYAEHAVLAQSLADSQFGPQTLKHLRQNSAIIGILQHLGLLEEDSVYVELGSGKAQLSYWLSGAVTRASHILLVDRASHRHKAENKLKDLTDVPDIQRLKMDIRHLHLAGCSVCLERPLVVVGKHLCGAASDLGIRAVMDRPSPVLVDGPTSVVDEDAVTPVVCEDERAPTVYENERASVTASTESAVPSTTVEGNGTSTGVAAGASSDSVVNLVGLVIALCCHHRVDWNSYVGLDFLAECGFDRSELNCLKGIAAWATCGTPSWKSADTETQQSTPSNLVRSPCEIQQNTPSDLVRSPHETQQSTPSDAARSPYETQQNTLSHTVRTPCGTQQNTLSNTVRTPCGTQQNTLSDTVRTPYGTQQNTPSDTVRTPCETQQNTLSNTVRTPCGTQQNTPSDAVRSARVKSADTSSPATISLVEDDAVYMNKCDQKTVNGPQKRCSSESIDDGPQVKCCKNEDCSVPSETSAARYRRLDLTPERRTRLGFQCKRLLDMGRVARLRDAGFESRLVRFVPESVSPENVALLAVSRRHASDTRNTAGLLSVPSFST